MDLEMKFSTHSYRLLPRRQVRIGRIAGQYAKPRSSATEKVGDRDVMVFR
jgi:3-deoxy-D-arabino-heptulosonate 7-phosphate (DAHP) synthase class II